MDDSYTKGRRVSITPFNFKYKENSARWLKDPLGEKFAWGKGYAAEVLGLRIPYVFEERGLRRLEASCVAQNAAMVRLLEKAGFVREGVKRELFFRDGQWHDLLLYAMLKQDYLKNKPR